MTLEEKYLRAIELLKAINDSRILFKYDIILDAHVATFLSALDNRIKES